MQDLLLFIAELKDGIIDNLMTCFDFITGFFFLLSQTNGCEKKKIDIKDQNESVIPPS